MQDNHTEHAASIGRQHGTNAASYVFDGNTPDQTYRTVLDGIQENDPVVMDAYRAPDLSGEYADSYSERDLASDLGISLDNTDAIDAAADAWLDAASEAFWAEIERVAREHVTEVTARALRDAGYPVLYAYRPEGDRDYVSWSDRSEYPADNREPYADLTRTGKANDSADQADTVQRSNYRSLMRDYPDVFTYTSYSNCDALGVFVADLTDELVNILVKLATEYPVYDESDQSELESDDITESWEQYVSSDIRSEIQSDVWDDLTSDQQCRMFWRVVHDRDLYPEHDGLDVRWNYGPIAAEIDKRLEKSEP